MPNPIWLCCGNDFNSKVVRLKVATIPKGISRNRAFQFQSGTIKSENFDFKRRIITIFQFQSGTIKRQPQHRLAPIQTQHFNSKVVRLKVPLRWERL